MAISEIRKRAAYFLLFAGLMVLILILVSSILDQGIQSYLNTSLGVKVDPKGVPVMLDDSPVPDGMLSTWVNLVLTLVSLVKIVLCMAIVVSTVRFFGYLITATAYRKAAAPSEIATLLRTIISVVVYIVGFFIIFQHYFPTVQLAPLFTGSTIIGIVVGLALQDTLGNLFAGLALQADQPFQVGDVVIIPGRGEGVIESVSWRGIKIRTFQNKLLVISNSILGKEIIEVAPRTNLNAKLVFFNTMYVHSPARTIQVVRDAVRQVENVSSKMRPVVRIRHLGDNGIDWEVKYWLDDYTKQHDTDALIRQRIWYVFNREKINFAFPTRTIHVEEKLPEAAPEEVFNTIAERLGEVSIFAPLDEEEIEKLANASTTRVYAPGEPIVRIGQEGHSMCVIIRGSVKVQVPERDYQKTINTLRENDFFGEMSLLTGEPRSATVIAVEETEVLRIEKTGLKPILESNPRLVQSICEMVEERRELLKQIDAIEDEGPESEKKRGMMRSIKQFFGLRR